MPTEIGERSPGVAILQLIGINQKQAPAKGRELIERTRQQLTDVRVQRNFVELIETIFIYKFPKLSSQEVARMLGLGELKQTRVYQEGREEERQEMLKITVPLLLDRGMTIDEIAQRYGVPIETIQPFAAQNQQSGKIQKLTG